MRFWLYVSKSIKLYLHQYNKGGNHKIDIYKQTISAVYTTEKKNKEILHNKEKEILPRWSHMVRQYTPQDYNPWRFLFRSYFVTMSLKS